MSSNHAKNKINWETIRDTKTLLLILIGTGLAVLAMKGFMIPNMLMDGGVTGISILIHEIFHFNISLLVVLFNLPFIYLSYKKIGKTFAIITSISVVFLALGLFFINIPPITNDKLLIAVFGGVLIGTGVGLVIRAGGVLDGAEVIVVFTKRKSGFSNSEILLLMNAIIFSVAGFYFGLETAMYSLITYFSATKTIEYVVEGIEEFTSMNIVTSKEEEIKSFLVNDLGKAITVYKGIRGHLPGKFNVRTDCEIIVIIITRLEIKQIQDELVKIDSKVFTYVQSVKEASGGILKEKAHVK